MFALIGTITTKHGLVHAAKAGNETNGYHTVCKRAYINSPLDEPMGVVTCVYCVTGKPWPTDLSTRDLPES